MATVLGSLREVAAHPKQPLVMSISPSSVSANDLAEGRVSLSVSDVLGKGKDPPVAPILGALTDAEGKNVLGERIPLKSSKTGVWALDMPAVAVPSGSYTAEIKLPVAGRGGKEQTAKIPLNVVPSSVILPSDVAVTIADETYSSPLPAGLQASALVGDVLQVSFNVAADQAIHIHQAFARFTHQETLKETVFVAKNRGANDRWEITISLAEQAQILDQRSGVYELSILIGSALMQNGAQISLGSLAIEFPPTRKTELPLYARQLLYDSDVALDALPEKHHTFRVPEARPSAAASVLFSLLILLCPATLLVKGMKKTGADLSRIPSSSSGVFWVLIYEACLGSILILFAVYWLNLTMVVTIKMLAPLAAVTIFTGRKVMLELLWQQEEKTGHAHKD
ncbi:unnamed protein product [Chrysoparadoxa australica]